MDDDEEIERRALQGFSQQSPWAPRSRTPAAPLANAAMPADPIRRGAGHLAQRPRAAWNGDPTGGARMGTATPGSAQHLQRRVNDPYQQRFSREEQEYEESPGVGMMAPRAPVASRDPYSTRRSWR